eukprot:TRINITY_DN114980_c0_g1_i1.p1 TRINITY_DN114980_c0_g1~~TRINITY_DN114980_c0_g1_i1.p1  ORF type:complete len:360 (-),score=42.37 TRINITY_DN114980_c0_g1_i1:44-1123(-)
MNVEEAAAPAASSPQPSKKPADPVTGSRKKGFLASKCRPSVLFAAFQEEFTNQHARMRLLESSSSNAAWPQVFGTSPWLKKPDGWTFFAIRLSLFVTFLFHYVWSMARHLDEGYWFIYLTNWSLTVEVLYFGFATWTTYEARRRVVDDSVGRQMSFRRTSGRLPPYVRATWILAHVAMPASVLVFAMYWTLDNPIWAMHHQPQYLGYFVHGINALLCLFDLVMSRNLFYLRHALWFAVYILCFAIWTVIHYFAELGTYQCDAPDANKCPIYSVLNWQNLRRTSTLCLLILCCAVPLCQYPLWYCATKRRQLDEYLTEDDNKSASAATVQSSESEKPTEVAESSVQLAVDPSEVKVIIQV